MVFQVIWKFLSNDSGRWVISAWDQRKRLVPFAKPGVQLVDLRWLDRFMFNSLYRLDVLGIYLVINHGLVPSRLLLWLPSDVYY